MPKEIHAILTEILGEYAPSYTTVKNQLAQFKRGGFSTCDAPRPGRPKTVTTPEIIDQIHELLKDRRISAKSIAEQLIISRITSEFLLEILEVLQTMLMHAVIMWNMTPCRSVNTYRRFGEY